MFWGCFLGYSVSLISHKNTFLSDFVSFQTILLLLYPQFQNQLSSSDFLTIVGMSCCWIFFGILISSFIHGGSLSLILMTLLLTKFEKILNRVSFSIFTYFSTFALENNLFQSIMFKAF